ncbi:MAG: hypothetical protein U0N15_05690 [Bifidobacterium choerinum]
MTTTHDTSISWMDCPVCAELHREVERADAEADKAWETFSFFEATYREAFAAGMVGFGTTAWTQWHDLLDQLRHAYYDATDTARARLDAWSESIREHDGHKPQPAAEPAEAPASTEKKATISMADAAAEQKALEELWYGDVHDFELPDDIMDGSWALLHAASVAISVYMRLLEQYAPATAKGYPAWVANRLRDVLDETAIQRATGEEKTR